MPKPRLNFHKDRTYRSEVIMEKVPYGRTDVQTYERTDNPSHRRSSILKIMKKDKVLRPSITKEIAFSCF